MEYFIALTSAADDVKIMVVLVASEGLFWDDVRIGSSREDVERGPLAMDTFQVAGKLLRRKLSVILRRDSQWKSSIAAMGNFSSKNILYLSLSISSLMWL